MKKEVVVLGVRKYDFVSEDGEKVEGTRVYFFDEDREVSNDIKGYVPSKRWFPGFEKFEQFQNNELPGKYEMEYDIRISETGLKLVIKGFSYLGVAEPIV